MNPVDSLKAVLCEQDGKCCIAGSEADRKAVDEALAALDTAQPKVKVIAESLYDRTGDIKDFNTVLIGRDALQELEEACAAQPVQVNAMLVEALEAAEKLEHEALVALSEATDELKVGNTYTTATDTYKAHNDLIHRLDKILNSQYRDRKRTALDAAKQAQPALSGCACRWDADAIAAPQPAQESIECDCGRIHKKTSYGWVSSEPAQPEQGPST